MNAAQQTTNNFALDSTPTAIPVKPDTSNKITHIVMPYGDQISMLVPMLAFLSQQDQDKWFTCVTPTAFNCNIFKEKNIECEQMRVVRAAHIDDRLWMAWDALANGNSGTVVLFIERITEAERKHLEDAASIGNTRGLIIEARSLDTHPASHLVS